MPQARPPTKQQVRVPIKKTPKPPVPETDNTIAYAVGFALFLLVLGFVLSWFYMQSSSTPLPEIEFAKTGTMEVHNRGYTISANVAVQTSTDDAHWARQNMKTFTEISRRDLAALDPDQLRTTEGIRALQQSLKDEINGAFKPPRVTNVYLTDLMMSAD
jgi:flagellar basal body-associated protein FliL